MKKTYLLSALRKNGFLVYKNEKNKEMIIRKRSDFLSEELFRKLSISFSCTKDAETFVREHKLSGVEVVEVED